MKSTVIALFLLFSVPLFSQGVFSNSTNSALQKVIEDYPNKFRNIQGDKIATAAQGTDYKSKIEVPGAGSSIISHYVSSKTSLYAWKSELFESADFDQSSSHFKETYNSIKNTIVKIEGMPAFILNGKYEYPASDKKTTTVHFQLLPANAEMQKLSVQLSMIQSGSNWKVVLSVFEKANSGEEIAGY